MADKLLQRCVKLWRQIEQECRTYGTFAETGQQVVASLHNLLQRIELFKQCVSSHELRARLEGPLCSFVGASEAALSRHVAEAHKQQRNVSVVIEQLRLQLAAVSSLLRELQQSIRADRSGAGAAAACTARSMDTGFSLAEVAERAESLHRSLALDLQGKVAAHLALCASAPAAAEELPSMTTVVELAAQFDTALPVQPASSSSALSGLEDA